MEKEIKTELQKTKESGMCKEMQVKNVRVSGKKVLMQEKASKGGMTGLEKKGKEKEKKEKGKLHAQFVEGEDSERKTFFLFRAGKARKKKSSLNTWSLFEDGV
jgi:hypothetical protein